MSYFLSSLTKTKQFNQSHFVFVFLINPLKPFIHQCFINLIFILKFSTAVIE